MKATIRFYCEIKGDYLTFVRVADIPFVPTKDSMFTVGDHCRSVANCEWDFDYGGWDILLESIDLSVPKNNDEYEIIEPLEFVSKAEAVQMFTGWELEEDEREEQT